MVHQEGVGRTGAARTAARGGEERGRGSIPIPTKTDQKRCYLKRRAGPLRSSSAALSTAADTRDLLHQQGERLLKFRDALTMALDLFQEDRKFKSITLRHRARG